MSVKEVEEIERPSFKRGDTACFVYLFTPPYLGFDWSTITIDCALTAVTAPNNNSGATALRLAQPLVVNADNTAQYSFQLSEVESKLLVPGTTYRDECQIRESSGPYNTTPITGRTKIKQDYVI